MLLLTSDLKWVLKLIYCFPFANSVVGGTGDELAKAVESILGTSGDVDMDDINKMAAGAVISGAIDPDDANVVIEDSGVIVETDAAVSALLGQQQPIKMHNGGALPVVHQTVVNGFPGTILTHIVT